MIALSSPSLVKWGPRTPEKALSVVPHPLKLHGKDMGIAWFHVPLDTFYVILETAG